MDAKNRRLYWVYRAMLKRCGLINGASKRHIDRYEKRGITVCDEWAKSWHAFRDWAWENGYGDGLQIDRIDNDGSYSPDNCRWVSGTRNMRNTSQTFPVIARRLIDGMEIRFESEADAAEFMSIPKSSIRDCVNGKQTQTHGFEWSKDNRDAERTCRVESSHEEESDGCYSYFEYELTCGHEMAWGDQLPPSYCPECGRRVLYDSDDYI